MKKPSTRPSKIQEKFLEILVQKFVLSHILCIWNLAFLYKVQLEINKSQTNYNSSFKIKLYNIHKQIEVTVFKLKLLKL